MKYLIVIVVLLLAIGASAQSVPPNAVDCDPQMVNGKEIKHCAVEPDAMAISVHPAPVPVLIGYGEDLKCNKSGCVGRNAYWTGNPDKSYVANWPKGWSPDWKDAKHYNRVEDYTLNSSVPNGQHCCYAEYVTPINPKTGEEDWTVVAAGDAKRKAEYEAWYEQNRPKVPKP
jgi:hypothetical protein